MAHRESFFVLPILALAVALAGSNPAFAHKMELSAKVEAERPDQLKVEAWYEYGDPCDGGKVLIVTAQSRTEVADGILDDDGVLFLPKPKPGQYRVIVDDGAGHREAVSLTIPAEEVEAVEVVSEQRNRWLMGGIGLCLIAGLTLAARFVIKKPS